MKQLRQQDGFTAAELLITLFIGAAFIGAAYQLYGMIVANSAGARFRAIASDTAYNLIRQTSADGTKIATVCAYTTPQTTTQTLTGTNLPGTVKAITTLSCPFTSPANSITTEIQVQITYGNSQEVTHAIYATSR